MNCFLNNAVSVLIPPGLHIEEKFTFQGKQRKNCFRFVCIATDSNDDVMAFVYSCICWTVHGLIYLYFLKMDYVEALQLVVYV